MPKVASQSDIWDFEVIQEPVTRTNKGVSTVIDNAFWNVRTDTDTVLGMTTKQYGLIQNRALMESARKELNARGLTSFEEKCLVSDGGARFSALMTFKDKTLALKTGDQVGYQFSLQNSFDRTKRTSLILGFLRLVCLNGMCAIDQEFEVTKKHNKDLTLDFMGKAIESAVDSAPKALLAFDALVEKKITNLEGVNALLQLKDRAIISGSLLNCFQANWLQPRRKEDEKRNLWTFWNACTEHLTHAVRTTRFEYAEKVNSGLLETLHSAATVPAVFAGLVAPVKNDVPHLTATGPVIDV